MVPYCRPYWIVCHSCTNLVHGIVLQKQWIWPIHDILFHKLTRKDIPKVCYLHEVCQPAIIHITANQDQWIWAIHDVIVPQTDAQDLTKKQCSLVDLPGMRENCISRTLPFTALSPQLMVRLHLVL